MYNSSVATTDNSVITDSWPSIWNHLELKFQISYIKWVIASQTSFQWHKDCISSTSSEICCQFYVIIKWNLIDAYSKAIVNKIIIELYGPEV